MDSPIVSVIIPAYNSSKYIAETIKSVLSQTFKNFELIIVDDGSTDDQQEIIQKYCESEIRIRSIYQENQGVSFARNAGFNHSKGKFIAFLDADDIWLEDNLQLKLDKFEQDDFALVHSDSYLIDENSKLLNGMMTGNEGMLLHEILKWKEAQVPGPSSILVKREVIGTVGLFDTNLSTSADHDFFCRLAALYKIGRVAKPTWKYRVHSQNMHKNIALMERDILTVYRKISRLKLFKSFWFKRTCYANMYLILAASWAGDGKNMTRGLYYTMLAILSHPGSILNIVNRLTRL